MPIITIDIGIGQADEDQKRRLVRRLTEEAVEITGMPAEKFTVFIHEFPFENIGVGGRTLKDIKGAQST
jgi:4-oxalocrotonate tautomerase